jgi:hypothetical protein
LLRARIADSAQKPPEKSQPDPPLRVTDVTAAAGIRFEHDVSPEKKYIVESMSGGVLLLDYDQDGWLDIYFTNAPSVEAELQIRLHQTDARLLRAIEEALARIKQGTFGVCQVCKQPVSKDRLESVPWTRLCRECKEREHSAA